VLVIDVRTELASPDYDLVRLLQRGKKPVLSGRQQGRRRRHGIRGPEPAPVGGYPRCVSAQRRTRTGYRDLLDAISDAIPVSESEQAAAEAEPEAAEPEELDETDEGEKEAPHPWRVRAA